MHIPTSAYPTSRSKKRTAVKLTPPPQVIRDIIDNVSSDGANALISKLKENQTLATDMKSYLEAVGATPSQTGKVNDTRLLKWSDAAPEDRPYLFLSKAQLINLCARRMPHHAARLFSSKPMDALRNLLKEATEGRSSTSASYLLSLELHKKLQKCIFDAIFMTRLAENVQAAARIGHLNESKCLQELVKQSTESDSIFHIKNAYYAGLVAITTHPYAKTSIDYICLASIEKSEYNIVGIEIKTRVAPGQAQQVQVEAVTLLSTRGAPSST
jgi:hypothetical protein